MKAFIFSLMFVLMSSICYAEQINQIGCVDTAWKLFGKNHQVCVFSINDPKIPEVSLVISQAIKGGITGSLGLAEDVSEFSIVVVPPIESNIIIKSGSLPESENIFDKSASVFFKKVHITRMIDEKQGIVSYLITSDRLIDGSPANSVTAFKVIIEDGGMKQ